MALPSQLSTLNMHYMMGNHVPLDVLQSFLAEKECIVTGRTINALLIGFCSHNSALGDHLIRLFASCGSLMEAELVFFTIAKPSVYTWQAIISAHANHGECAKAIAFYDQMKESGDVSSNKFIFAGVLKAYGRLQWLEAGKETHRCAINSGFDSCVLVGSTVIDMYAKCGCLQEARQVFNKLSDRNVVSWDALMMGYVQQGYADVAMELFDEMIRASIAPTKVTYLCILKACGNALALERGRSMHIEINYHGMESDVVVGNTLIDMYAKCGSIEEACQVFDCLSGRDQVSWGALISGCAHHDSDYALVLFRRMHLDGVNANKPMLLCILKACSNVGAWVETNSVYDLIVRNGIVLEKEIGNALLDAYAKCGCLREAHKVFVGLPSRDVVSYGAFISGCSLHGNFMGALESLDSMKHAGIKPNNFIFPCVLKCCGTLGLIDRGMLMHKDVINCGFSSDVVILNALVDMYGSCRRMTDARKVFDDLPLKNVVSWSAIIAGYVHSERYLCVIDCFARMQDEGIEPNKLTYLSSLKACGRVRSLACGRLLHDRMLGSGLEIDVAISNALIDMYCKCGDLDSAGEIFDRIQSPDEITWNVMISGYVQSGLNRNAIEQFERMVGEGQIPRDFTFPSILKACGSLRASHHLKRIHDRIIRTGSALDAVVGSALIDAYAKCGSLADAQRVFDDDSSSESHEKEAMRGMLMAGYAHHGRSDRVLELFCSMQERDLNERDISSLPCVLKACGETGAVGRGHRLHDLIIRGALDERQAVASALVDLYARCGSLDEARKVFDGVLRPDVVVWGSMLAGYAEQGSTRPAVELFQSMLEAGVEPNNAVCLSLLKACCKPRAGGLERGRLIHAEIVRWGLESDPRVGNALVGMYSRREEVEAASAMFARLPDRDAASWASLMAGYAECGRGGSALEAFQAMHREGVCPGRPAYLCALKACASSAALDRGRLVHHEIVDDGLESDARLANALVSMYARCGIAEEALTVFGQLEHPETTAASWSALLGGLSRSGNAGEAPGLLLEHVRGDGILPHGPMYCGAIAACGRIGNIGEGQRHFLASMQETRGIEPPGELLGCFADLLARSGLLIQASHVLLALPPPAPADAIRAWTSLLAACKTYGSVHLASRCFDAILGIDPDSAPAYMLMSDVYAGAQMWEDYRRVQELRGARCAWKRPGTARIELRNRAADFVVGQHGLAHSNPLLSLYIHRLLDALKSEGYVPCLDMAPGPIGFLDVKTLGAQGCNNSFCDSFPYRRCASVSLVL